MNWKVMRFIYHHLNTLLYNNIFESKTKLTSEPNYLIFRAKLNRSVENILQYINKHILRKQIIQISQEP